MQIYSRAKLLYTEFVFTNELTVFVGKENPGFLFEA